MDVMNIQNGDTVLKPGDSLTFAIKNTFNILFNIQFVEERFIVKIKSLNML